MTKIFLLSTHFHAFWGATFVCAPLPQCVLLSHSVCSSDLVEQYTWRILSDNTIIDNVHEYPEACDWVSKVEIGLISCKASLNSDHIRMFAHYSLQSWGAEYVVAALVGHLVGLLGCVPSPLFLKRGTPLYTPSGFTLHFSVECMCAAKDLGSHPLSTMYTFELVYPVIHVVR